MEVDKQKYDQYVKEVTPVHSLAKSMACAFLVGGIICCLGQFFNTFMTDQMGMEKEAAAAWTSLELIFLSVILTGLNIYQKLVKFGGAGALVPITGFANSVPLRPWNFTPRARCSAWAARSLPSPGR